MGYWDPLPPGPHRYFLFGPIRQPTRMLDEHVSVFYYQHFNNSTDTLEMSLVNDQIFIHNGRIMLVSVLLILSNIHMQRTYFEQDVQCRGQIMTRYFFIHKWLHLWNRTEQIVYLT